MFSMHHHRPLSFTVALYLLANIVFPTTSSLAGSDAKGAVEPKRPSKHSRLANHNFHPVSTFDDPYGDEQVRQAPDPLEKINRGTFAFNHQFYRFVAKPIADVTKFVLPKPVRTALVHVIDNLETPVRVASCLLQGKVKRAGQETGKFIVNSTLGVGGLWSPAEKIDGLKALSNEDIGQTIGSWGVPSGPYIVIPVLGPSSARDVVGKVADVCLTPMTWVSPHTLNTLTNASVAVVKNPGRMDVYDAATKDAIDPYISMRESYLSYRDNAVRN
jgi:phospholipid-binding lipoprotein MlaA